MSLPITSDVLTAGRCDFGFRHFSDGTSCKIRYDRYGNGCIVRSRVNFHLSVIPAYHRPQNGAPPFTLFSTFSGHPRTLKHCACLCRRSKSNKEMDSRLSSRICPIDVLVRLQACKTRLCCRNQKIEGPVNHGSPSFG